MSLPRWSGRRLGAMREAYHDSLEELAERLADMTGMVAEAMQNATAALLQADLGLAEQVISGDQKVDDVRASIEEQSYALLALQAPVATDLRTVLAVIHAAESVERMGDLALHVAKAARRRHPQPVLGDDVKPYFTEMGRIAVELAREATEIIRTQDVDRARSIEDADDAMDDLHRHL